MHTAESGVDSIPRDQPVMQTYDRVQAAFPSEHPGAEVVVKAGDVTSPKVRHAIQQLTAQASTSDNFVGDATIDVSRDHTVADINVPLAGDGNDSKSMAALAELRDEIVPTTVGQVAGAETVVGGDTASTKDFNDVMKSHVVFVFAFVLSAAFLLLLVTFRSIVIPIKAIALNLLSVGASYGLLVLVFQKGYGESLLGFESTGAITAWLPLFLFVVLFGLSMDYHVFILTRIREAFDRGMTSEEAVEHGIKSTASVVTSAAFVMVAVFAIFATLSFIDFKQMGVGLAAAVLIDATIIRGVLLPATMKLLGDYNWYLPKSLGWLPKIQHEPEVQPATA
jgi:RND superfamily putative drug exporter